MKEASVFILLGYMKFNLKEGIVVISPVPVVGTTEEETMILFENMCKGNLTIEISDRPNVICTLISTLDSREYRVGCSGLFPKELELLHNLRSNPVMEKKEKAFVLRKG